MNRSLKVAIALSPLVAIPVVTRLYSGQYDPFKLGKDGVALFAGGCLLSAGLMYTWGLGRTR